MLFRSETVGSVRSRFPETETDETLWSAVKLAFIPLLHEHKQPECAETFFNSVACKVLHRRYYRNEFIFWRPAVATEHLEGDEPSYRCHYPGMKGLRPVLAEIVSGFGLATPWENRKRDLRNLVRALRAAFPRPARAHPNLQILVLGTLFFRNKAAYIIGKAINGHREYPFAVPILQNERRELFLDALLLDPEQLVLLFSFARAYFMVDMEVPAAYVSFLRTLMPEKPRAETYASVGLQKQGKTLFYRDLHYHLNHSSDRFIAAPGIKGLVMLVFTLPSFPYVFKLIKDHFPAPKDVTREIVKDKYLLVKYHDRVGRMADTLEYSLVALPRARFDPALIEELREQAGSSVEFEGDSIVIKHMYIERRMTPLNIYLEEAAREGDAPRVRHALREYGDAIKDLAGADIFPGDMLLKNFGVTRHERVVFYDYDEIAAMTECNFRRIPEARDIADEMASEPWYSIGPQDVFPEQFGSFLVADERAREVFFEYHRDLIDPAYWAGKQAAIRDGIQEDVFSYPRELRFARN